MAGMKRLRQVCGIMYVLCFAVAAGRLAASALPLIDPKLSSAHLYCQPVHCWVRTDPGRLLDPLEPDAAARLPANRGRLDRLLEEPQVRGMLTVSGAVRAVPSFLLFLFLALAFRRFAKGDGFEGRATSWLRRAAAAALAAVLAQPVADTIRASALSPVTTGRSQIFIAFDGGPFFWGLLLAGAVWVAVWALDEARHVEAELAEIV